MFKEANLTLSHPGLHLAVERSGVASEIVDDEAADLDAPAQHGAHHLTS